MYHSDGKSVKKEDGSREEDVWEIREVENVEVRYTRSYNKYRAGIKPAPTRAYCNTPLQLCGRIVMRSYNKYRADIKPAPTLF